jgi:hypothetical protein
MSGDVQTRQRRKEKKKQKRGMITAPVIIKYSPYLKGGKKILLMKI